MQDNGDRALKEPSTIATFDKASGSFVERILFNNRAAFLMICFALTIFLGLKALDTKISIDFNQTIPTHQSFIRNYLQHYTELQAQANVVQVSVTANKGTIIDAKYLDTLKRINDEVYLLPGVNRPFMTSLWTSNTRWIAVTPQGFDGGPVIGRSYNGSAAELNLVRQNIFKTGKLGKLVTNDFRSSMITVPLLDINTVTGKPLDYGDLAKQFDLIRKKYNAQGMTVHIIGFAMVVGDMIDGINAILIFFAVSVLIATAFLFWYTRCVRSTLLVVFASLVAVTWQMGLLSYLGYALTPYSVLVPFLVFSIGMSHGAQKMNGVMQDIGRGTHPLVAARHTFRRLFMAGFAALICDMTSFAVLMTINIQAIRQLAIIASIGVGLLVFTNLMMLPIMLSYTGVSARAAARSTENTPENMSPRKNHPLWNFLDLFTRRGWAIGAITVMIALGSLGWFVGRNVQIGDIQPGAPELRNNSLYNRDNAFIIKSYAAASDTFIVMADTQYEGCVGYDLLNVLDRLQWQLDQLPAVQGTESVASFSAYASMLLVEDSPKWYGIEPNQAMLDSIQGTGDLPSSLTNFNCTFAPVYVSLKDHRASTLTSVLTAVSNFIADPANQSPNFRMSLAGGNAGIQAATNIVIRQANRNMLFLVYAVVILFCLITFRSWRAVICAVVPLTITSLLVQALMVWLGIGIKVATLPVIALGVGIGVDYALYVLSILLKNLRMGASLSESYYRTLIFTGRVVILTGITLATGVITWIFAPIKFQADMGLLLAFMFLWNMLGAMILLPALAYFLLPPSLFTKTTRYTTDVAQ